MTNTTCMKDFLWRIWQIFTFYGEFETAREEKKKKKSSSEDGGEAFQFF